MNDHPPLLAQPLGIYGPQNDGGKGKTPTPLDKPSQAALDTTGGRKFRRFSEDEYSRSPINCRPSIEADMKKHNRAFGKALRDIRKEHGYTQETLAFECDLDRTYISLLELGSSSPTLDTIMALCGALGVSLTMLATRVETKMGRKKP